MFTLCFALLKQVNFLIMQHGLHDPLDFSFSVIPNAPALGLSASNVPGSKLRGSFVHFG